MLKLMGGARRDEEPERRCPWDRGPETGPGVGSRPRSGRVSLLSLALPNTGQTQRGLYVWDLTNGIINSIRPSLPLQELAFQPPPLRKDKRKPHLVFLVSGCRAGVQGAVALDSWGGEGPEVRSDVPEELLAGPPLQGECETVCGQSAVFGPSVSVLALP